jgi:hypothetical protein
MQTSKIAVNPLSWIQNQTFKANPPQINPPAAVAQNEPQTAADFISSQIVTFKKVAKEAKDAVERLHKEKNQLGLNVDRATGILRDCKTRVKQAEDIEARNQRITENLAKTRPQFTAEVAAAYHRPSEEVKVWEAEYKRVLHECVYKDWRLEHFESIFSVFDQMPTVTYFERGARDDLEAWEAIEEYAADCDDRYKQDEPLSQSELAQRNRQMMELARYAVERNQSVLAWCEDRRAREDKVARHVAR